MLNHLKSEANIAYTENGAVTNASTMSDCLDLFAVIGALRAADDQEIIRRFVRAYAEDADIAMKILFFGRDVRGGLGERRVFRVIINWLAENRAESLRTNIELIPEFGRYDDLVSLIGTACEKDALRTIRKQLEADLASDAEVSLLAKWLPSVNASNAETVRKAKRIARYLGMSDAEYRKTLVELRKKIRIIENHLREKDYSFDYAKQPSKAMFKYRKAFLRNDGERYVKGKNAKKYRRGVEYGSARWGSADDIRPYIDPVFENNVLLTQTERLMMNSRPKQPKYARNKNVLVVGGSGSGKTRFFVKPNLMQMHSSYLVSDPKGTLLLECGKLLERGSPKLGEDGKPVRKNGKIVYEPYRIKVLNTINFKKSMKYNPFAYLRDEKDILKLVNTLIANTKGSGEKSGEDFWVKAERLLYCALIGYIHYEAPDAERNFTTLLEMINASEAREDDSEFQSPVDLMFERLEEKDPEHFAVKQYKKFLLSAGKTRSSILISCGARLAPFDIKELRELIWGNELPNSIEM